ncbi:hypothetical protein Dvina_00060 [Dactylosporangium vinaceum]|uniref:Tyr recombinase domain-containing protein n=1 Tax=Dactylosporangium vinaceum TaxID=53362 RepID=A0ABV5MPS2_9ACTN|nr:hypothetical protein [Dactylosporangium vinaceum]UAB96688.1 hypothetical protein Dvina_00060 [Dactylosporangium vinaceum]
MLDITSGEPRCRTARLLFTTRHENPITDRIWSRERAKWRAKAGWPDIEHAGFRALRHFFAPTLISQHVEPQEVQRALRHKTSRSRWGPTCTGGPSGQGSAVRSGRLCKKPGESRN